MAAIKTSISIAFGLLLASCGPPARDWTGDWQGELPQLSPDAPSDSVSKTLRKVKLTVRVDGTFSLVRAGMPAEGEWNRDNGGLVLHFRKVMGQPLERQAPEIRQQYVDAKVEVTKEDKVVLVDPGDFNRDPVQLVRAKPSDD